MERTKEQVAPSVAALTLDLDACLAAVAERTRIDEEERLQKEAARENERRLVEDAATVVANLVLARLPVALREPGQVTVVDVRDACANTIVPVTKAEAVRDRVSALLDEFFGEAAPRVEWKHDASWRFWTPAAALRSAIEQTARWFESERRRTRPKARYQRAVERLRECHEETWRRARGAVSSERDEETLDKARTHLAEVLGEGIPGLIDLCDVRFCSDVPCDVLRAEGDIIDENGAALLRKGECFAVERDARAEGDLARVKLMWWDESGTYRNEFALAMQPAAVVGECRDANLKDACAAGRLK